MKITIDVKPGALKRAFALVGGLVIIGGIGAIAQAVPTTFADGNVLTAAQLNDNFAALETRLAALEAKRVVLQTGVIGGSLSESGWGLESTTVDGSADRAVTFPTPFAKVPKVIVSIKSIDAGVTTNHLMLDAGAINITATGFTVRFSDYSDSSIWAANATWIAYTDD